jgi:hypothetical protein
MFLRIRCAHDIASLVQVSAAGVRFCFLGGW